MLKTTNSTVAPISMNEQKTRLTPKKKDEERETGTKQHTNKNGGESALASKNHELRTKPVSFPITAVSWR